MHVMFSHQTHVSQIMQHNDKNVRRKTEQTQNRTNKLHSPHTAMALVCTSKSPHSHGPGLHHQVTTQSHGTGLHHLKVYRFIHELIHYYCISFHKCFYCHISQPGNCVVINRMKNSAISASGKQAWLHDVVDRVQVKPLLNCGTEDTIGVARLVAMWPVITATLHSNIN